MELNNIGPQYIIEERGEEEGKEILPLKRPTVQQKI
jgi:hypothetical protein